jgi:membrane protease YdiL (CAAX protease family)
MTDPIDLPPAALPSITPRALPRIWPSLLAFLVGPFAAAAVGGIVLVLAVLSGPEGSGEDLQARCLAWIAGHVETLPGVLVLLLPGQLTFLAIAVAMSARSRRGTPFRGGILRRLGFAGSSIPLGTTALAVLGTLGVQWAVSMVVEAFGAEPSEHLKEMWRMMSAPQGVDAVLVCVLVSFVPGVCEEAFFRGLGQKRMLERWPPPVAIGIASAVFAIAHFDLQLSLAVFPIGLWLGIVAWRTGSVRTSAVCHAANNLAAFVVGRMWGEPESGNLPNTAPFLAVGIGLCLCTLLAARTLVRAQPAPG